MSAAACDEQTPPNRMHARLGDLKKVSDHSRCGDCGENNQQQEIKYLSMLIIAARGVGAGTEAVGLQRADRRLL